MLINDGEAFLDRGGVAGVDRGRWAWGSNFVDLNNDGWEDLLVANGFLTSLLSVPRQVVAGSDSLSYLVVLLEARLKDNS